MYIIAVYFSAVNTLFTKWKFYDTLYTVIQVTKKELRAEIRSLISGLSAEYKEAAGKAIAENILYSPAFINARSVFIYVSTEKEPDTSNIIKEALEAGKRVFVPKCLYKGVMIPVKLSPDTVFESGYMGISEPAEYDLSISVTEIDLSLIPCLTANEKGERLGHGAGFYDRFLSGVKTEKMCLCFGKILSDNIPTDGYDIKMDYVVTENGILKM